MFPCNSLFGFVLNQKIFANSKMTFKTSYGILLALGILALVQLHATASTSTSTREFFILPNLNAPCPTRPCYILSQVMDNSSQYFTSNTRAVFPPGHHEVSTEGLLVIQNVNNISLVGDNTMIKCKGQFGLSFVNITNLKISSLCLLGCGAAIPHLPTNLSKILYSRHPSYPSIFSIYLLHITNLTVTNLVIIHSKGMLGANIFGVATVQQAVFVNNTPNCAIVFMDSYSQAATSLLYITDSLFMFGKACAGCIYNNFAPGLNILAIQTTYPVTGYIRNVTVYGNVINMLVRINCKVAIKVIQLNCTEGYYYGLVLGSKGDSTNCRSLITTNCRSFEAARHFYISNSYFARNTIGAVLNLITYSACVKLENITVEHQKNASLKIALNHSSTIIMENVNINHNRGAMRIISTNLETSLIEFHGSSTFADNNHQALCLYYCNVTFHGNTTFRQNKGRYGGAINAQNAAIHFQGTVMFLENEGEYGGALMLSAKVSLVTEQLAEVSFVRNQAQESGGAVYARDSQIIIKIGQRLLFLANEGNDGGAMTLDGGSTIYLEANSNITFISNYAYNYGGAIYYVDEYTEDYAELNMCFYGILSTEVLAERASLRDVLNYIDRTQFSIEFYNNTAQFAGAAIYGGSVDLCMFHVNFRVIENYDHRLYQATIFDRLFHFHQPTQKLSLVSSNPTRVCLCTPGSFPDCSITEYTMAAYPGETITIPAVAVGQRFGTVPSTVQSSFVSRSSSRLPALQYTQLVNVNCTDLMYTILSPPNRNEVVKLKVEQCNIPQNMVIEEAVDSLLVNNTLINLQFSELTVQIEVQPCPLGFVFNNNPHTCICHPKLQQHEINCSIDTQTIYRRSPLWINATFLNETYTQILVHNHCPFDYCSDENIELNMEQPDEQCALSRSGVLCGSCQQNLSHVLGTSNCKECSSHLLLLIPVFIAAGIVLVVFLTLLNLTVSVGTINGLIFYANIVRANQAIFFPHGTNNAFLSIFIAWLNLDLGIETCFYSGLDAYAKTWLQFLFPLYIWTIVVLIIVSSHYSTTAAKLSGRNAVQVLATLFLLSYAKLLRITITALSFTLLEYPDGSVKRIWLYDGNVDYLKGKHTALFVAALLLLLCISIPYTVALLFIQCLQYRSRYRILAWVRRLKPLFDAYTGPYKDKHRYWPGLLLVVRVVLFLVFSVNVFGDPAVSLLTIIVTTFCILYFTSNYNFGGIHKNIVLNVIEYSFFLNLGILSSAILFTTLTGRDQTAVVYTSVAIAFATFMIITFYHILVRVTKVQQRQRCSEWAISKLKFTDRSSHRRNKQNNHPRTATHNPLIELREPLLESAN